jgi:hypothetical protein
MRVRCECASADAPRLYTQDPARREQHLSKAAFQALFGFGVEAFNALPGWKQMTLRKKHDLF